ncbi:hypothetical protein HKD37_02G003107 [Glycine soja]
MTQSMSHKPLDSRHTTDSCLLQLRTWKPFKLQQDGPHPKPYYHKRPCLSDRTTTSFSLDMSKLTLADDDNHNPNNRATNYRLVARKRRRRGSRSVSGRSSDRSGTRRCCSVGASAAYGTCSDFPVAMGTDSSGELFGNGDPNWSSDVSEAKNSRRERERDGGSGEKENVGVGFGVSGCSEANGNESGYGSEPGYRGDAEFGYGDEFDEEEDDPRLLFWGDQLGEDFKINSRSRIDYELKQLRWILLNSKVVAFQIFDHKGIDMEIPLSSGQIFGTSKWPKMGQTLVHTNLIPNHALGNIRAMWCCAMKKNIFETAVVTGKVNGSITNEEVLESIKATALFPVNKLQDQKLNASLINFTDPLLRVPVECGHTNQCVMQEWIAVDSKMEMVGENTLLDQKSHHRCRRRKHDCRMVDALR